MQNYDDLYNYFLPCFISEMQDLKGCFALQNNNTLYINQSASTPALLSNKLSPVRGLQVLSPPTNWWGEVHGVLATVSNRILFSKQTSPSGVFKYSILCLLLRYLF